LRTLPTAIVVQGGPIGIMIALPLLNWVIIRYSWHWAFAVLGVTGLLWSVVWLALGREGSMTADRATESAPVSEGLGYGRLLRSPTILATWCAVFGANWALSQALSWQGAFLIKGLGLSQASIGLLGPLPAAASAVAMLAAGWYSQRLLARGVSSRVARGVVGGGCVAIGGAALALMPYLPGVVTKVAMTTIGLALPSVIYVIGNAVIGEMAPVTKRGALLAISTAVGTSAGLLAPYVMGSMIETAATPLDGFNIGFIICGVVMLMGGVAGMALIHPERETKRWNAGMSLPALGSA
jgi:MFS family permease